MMRARTIFVAAAVGATAIALITSALAASGAPATRSTTERYYISETWHAISRPNAKEGKPTDIYAFQSSLTTMTGKKVGEANGYAVNLRQPFVAWNATATLPNGTLSLAATYDMAHGPRLLVVSGGSGAYLGARGTVTLTDAGDRGDLAVVSLDR